MINGRGKSVHEITAAQAALNATRKLNATRNPYNEEEMFRADLMKTIQEYSMRGNIAYNLLNRLDPLPQPTIDWLVSLGYQVFHSKPYMTTYGPPKMLYSYIIYWEYPKDSDKPFASGERFAYNYNDGPVTPDEPPSGAV